MRDYTQYKRIIKCLSSAVIVALEAGIYGFVWTMHYNKIIAAPFWRRGNWLMIAIYMILLLFFEQTYGGFKVGFIKMECNLFTDPFPVYRECDYILSDCIA